MVFNNPLPSSLAEECQKCGRILTSFIDPREAFGPEKVIPPAILENAKGLAILTVVKAGFIGSARFGSGLVVARRANGAWSAPSAIGTFGAGVGGQLGFEFTDFVFILNDDDAVMTFAQAGSVTLGGNVSVAAGPVGRNAEAAGAASLRAVSGIFSYSKTKGLFAGVSLEGSAIVERRDANEKLYGQRFRARELLTGVVEPPREAAPLMTVLNSRAFGGLQPGGGMYNGQRQSGQQQQQEDDVAWGQGQGFGAARRAESWGTQPGGISGGAGGAASAAAAATPVSRQTTGVTGRSAAAEVKKVPPPRPTGPKPDLGKRTEAIAMYTFDADQDGDLGFDKGDVITVVKKTDNETDWWTGRIGDREGVFPSNYVKMRD
jgi:lipid-binding SYLF domain-containing protein